jgi:hypothetical protein
MVAGGAHGGNGSAAAYADSVGIAPSFVDTLDLDHSEIWLGGEPVTGSAVAVVDDERLTIDGISMDFMTEIDSSAAAGLAHLLSKTPRFQELRASGLSLQDAYRQYSAEIDAAFAAVHTAFLAGGHASALATMTASPLFESIETVSDGILRFRYRGWGPTNEFNARHPVTLISDAERRQRQARAARNHVRTIARYLADGRRFVALIKPGLGMSIYSGEKAQQVSAQLHHARAGKPLADLPEGELDADHPSIRAAASLANRGNR